MARLQQYRRRLLTLHRVNHLRIIERYGVGSLQNRATVGSHGKKPPVYKSSSCIEELTTIFPRPRLVMGQWVAV